jgi:LPS O-antigen subunit length determinant protein (WzzB/FepE family)
MAQNLTQPSPHDDEVDLREIIKILIESKKLIISTILIFTIVSIIYSLSLKPSFNSSTKLEIGYVYLKNGDSELIESPSDLISDLKVLIMKNQDGKFSNKKISMNSYENKIISLETTSSSGEQNENLLTEISSYIYERHSNLALLSTNRKKTEISQKIETIESMISFLKAKQLDENQAKKLTITRNLENVKSELSFIKAKQLDNDQLKRSNIEDRIAKLKSDLPIIDLEISQFEKVIIEDTNNLSLLKENEKIRTERASNSPTLEQIIFSYKSEINDLKAKKYSNILETKSLNNQLITLDNVTLQSDELFSLEQEQQILENKLITLDNVTLQSDELFKLEQSLKITENELQLLMTQTQIKTRPISNIETKTIKPKTQVTILLGLIIGFITSIFMVFIRNFVRSYKESEV